MKKNVLVVLIVISLIVSILSGCNKSEMAVKESIPLSDPITQSKNSINVTVDPRIELLSIVQYLSNYRELDKGLLITDYNFNYKALVGKHFNDFKNHEAVKFFDKISKQGLRYDAPPTLMLHMNDTFTYREDAPLSDYIIMRSGGKANIDEFFELLEDFSTKSGFVEFFNNNKEYYNTIISNTLLLIDENKNIIPDLEDYYGLKQHNYNLVLVSLYGVGAFGPMIETEEGNEIYSIIGTQGLNGNYDPSFGTIYSFEYLQQHEFSHSFINPITSNNVELVNSYKLLFEPIKEQMNKMAYGNWETCLNEHIIRALSSRFIYSEDPESGLDVLKQENENGFIYVEQLFKKLEFYENNRDKYPTIEDFYPELLKALE